MEYIYIDHKVVKIELLCLCLEHPKIVWQL
jgi:hypothetical protein